MEVKDLEAYVRHTPCNTNPRVVRSMANQIAGAEFGKTKKFVLSDGTEVEGKFSDVQLRVGDNDVEKIVDERGDVIYERPDYLCFTAEEAGATIAMTKTGNPDPITLETSFDQITWTPFIPTETTITLENIGDTVYFKGKNNTICTSNHITYTFLITKSVSAYGSIMSLLDGKGISTTITHSDCFYALFKGATSLLRAPKLPATILATGCYGSMFDGCTELILSPELPAKNLTDWCYNNMFFGCRALTTAPELPAIQLVQGAYSNMFYGCIALTKIKLNYTGNFANAPTNAFDDWVKNVSATGDFYYNGTDTTTGASAIPAGWTVHTFETEA